MICATAPGKVVLWGEYAVLVGAPALVMAVDRYARCEIDAHPYDGWQFSVSGHRAKPEAVERDRLLAAERPEADRPWSLVWQVLQVLEASALPAGGTVHLDTRGFQAPHGAKLGLGSSAAVATATYGAFGALLDQPTDFAGALTAHRRFQHNGGSGIDVAAAWFGGMHKVQRPRGGEGLLEVGPWALPSHLCIVFVFSGTSARTVDHLGRLREWHDANAGEELDELAAAAAALFEAHDALDALGHYVTVLWSLDQAAGLGIFSEPHCRLRQLAFNTGVVYKPCGAGGGDIGAAFATDAAAVRRFTRLAAEEGFLPLALETASHGIEVTG